MSINEIIQIGQKRLKWQFGDSCGPKGGTGWRKSRAKFLDQFGRAGVASNFGAGRPKSGPKRCQMVILIVQNRLFWSILTISGHIWVKIGGAQRLQFWSKEYGLDFIASRLEN